MASIDKRPDGKWRARWREYPSGPQLTKSFARKVDAERHLVGVQHDLATGAYVTPTDAQVTLGAYVKVHLARQPWRSSTAAAAGNALERHALGFFGDRPLGSIRKADVQAFVTGLDSGPFDGADRASASVRFVGSGGRGPADRGQPGQRCEIAEGHRRRGGAALRR